MKRKLSIATLVASVALAFTVDAVAQAKPEVRVNGERQCH